jgi:hypothetical protein
VGGFGRLDGRCGVGGFARDHAGGARFGFENLNSWFNSRSRYESDVHPPLGLNVENDFPDDVNCWGNSGPSNLPEFKD